MQLPDTRRDQPMQRVGQRSDETIFDRRGLGCPRPYKLFVPPGLRPLVGSGSPIIECSYRAKERSRLLFEGVSRREWTMASMQNMDIPSFLCIGRPTSRFGGRATRQPAAEF
jgi:hypothetical protein